MSPATPSSTRSRENQTAATIMILLTTATVRGSRCPCWRLERCMPHRLMPRNTTSNGTRITSRMRNPMPMLARSASKAGVPRQHSAAKIAPSVPMICRCLGAQSSICSSGFSLGRWAALPIDTTAKCLGPVKAPCAPRALRLPMRFPPVQAGQTKPSRLYGGGAPSYAPHDVGDNAHFSPGMGQDTCQNKRQPQVAGVIHHEDKVQDPKRRTPPASGAHEIRENGHDC